MRIIAGKAKGMKLLSPEGYNTTRPTLDRVKQSIFSIIQNRVEDAVIADIFAGTGSLGLEAASRGARQCYLIDRDKITFSLLKQNIERLKFEDICKCVNMDSYEGLRKFSQDGLVFDLIFIDPPYAKELIPPAIEIIHEKGLLQKDGLIVTKIDSGETIYEGNGSLQLIEKRVYGNTTVCLYRY